MKPLPTKAFKVRVTKADAKKARRYNDYCGCLLWQALHRQFGPHNIDVWCTQVKFNHPDGRSWFCIEDGGSIERAYDEKRETIKQPFRPFTVTLVPE